MRVVEIFEPSDELEPFALPIYSCPVSAGFPSPADDFIDLKLDLNKYLIKRPTSTFFVRVSGDSMEKAGIFDGSILTVDRSLFPADNKIVIAVINGECLVKRIRYFDNRIYLLPENDKYLPIVIDDAMSFEIWGVVTSVITTL